MAASFLPLVDICDNFKLACHRADLVSFYLTADLCPAVGLLWPEVVQALQDDNKFAVKEGRTPSWVFVPQAYGHAFRGVHFAQHLSTPIARSVAIAATCTHWRDTGLFASIIGGHMWRNELYPVYSDPFKSQTPENIEFEVERAASSLFGIVTYGVHMTVYRPPIAGSNEETMIWVPTRSKTKQTWPGHLDNTVAGGIPAGMFPFEALVKESIEEASLAEEIVRAHTRCIGAISYFFEKNGRWLQPEIEYTYELKIPPTTTSGELESFCPKPLDGEVESFELLPLSEVISRLHKKLFKPNCAVVLIDFLIHHGYITPENEPNFLEIVTRLHGRFGFEQW
ncbi:hypothetical protein EW145_g4423 [Phellinidium pouzarii]|uniref:Nudix hydrolase domain-containing protein n=1 Tax=Phellinidium pouzarii TaxID=167371 RepID=A0A4V6S163_9AGAM|nr:hypothetical protein EW145_g4423 [Phellinidium pouzarii]